MTFTIGENVGPYRIIGQLGQGGMATVYKAYHASLDRYVALKVLHPAFKEDPNFLGRFQREAKMVARLEHPNIVPVYAFEEHEGHPFLVMKYIEGKTLKARLQKGPLSENEILRITQAVGSALTYAHKKDILHRDVKPSNVLLANDGEIYLADFGLARLASVVDSTLSAEILVGTPQYISPEQASGVKELDARSDVYCFGVMLYEMSVGRVPFQCRHPLCHRFRSHLQTTAITASDQAGAERRTRDGTPQGLDQGPRGPLPGCGFARQSLFCCAAVIRGDQSVSHPGTGRRC